jgi:hypothetical protein
MASVDYHSGIPVLPATPPQTETTANGLGWLLNALAQAGWRQGGRGTTAAAMVEKCFWRLILLVFCAYFYVGVIVVVTENR